MNLFQLIFKQMRQRSLSTCLTLLSVMLGVTLAVAIMILGREGQNLFAQSDFGYEVIIGPPKGSPLQLTLNTVYHMDVSPGVIPYQIYEDMHRTEEPLPGHPDYRSYVQTAIPFVVGDSFMGHRIVGTTPELFGVDDHGQPIAEKRFEYRQGRSFELAAGRIFAPRRFEGVVGSAAAKELKLKLYDDKLSEEENEKQGGAFRVTHGMPGPNDKPDIHKPRVHIVGILKPTGTANDRVLFIPFISLHAIAEHTEGMIDQALLRANINPSRIPADRVDEVLQKLGIDPNKVPESMKKKFKAKAAPAQGQVANARQDVGELIKNATAAPEPRKEQDQGEDPDAYHLEANGDIVPDLPQEEWELSAILVKTRGGFAAQQLLYNFKVVDDRASAANPANVMRDFFGTFLEPSTKVLLLVSFLVTIVAAASIMTTIYNSVSARRREMAILRALGATRMRILSLICLEALLIGAVGAVAGLALGHLLGAVGSAYLMQMTGEGINWLRVGSEEWAYLAAVAAIALVAGLVPALKAYSTPVATNLMAG